MTEVLGAVLRLEPDWDGASRPTCRRPVRHAAATLPGQGSPRANRRRLGGPLHPRSSGGSRLADAGSAGPMSQGPRWHRLAWMAAAGGLIALLAGAGVWLQMRPAPPSVVRTTITTSGSAALSLSGNDRDLVITPDGSRVVYRGNNQLLMRALNQVEPTVLTSSGAPRGVFVSPDGLSIGFFDGCHDQNSAEHGRAGDDRVRRPGHPRGATWGADGTIVFATNVSTGLQRVPAGGGEPTALTTPDRERGEGSLVARVPAWRQGGPLHDCFGCGRDRQRADRGAGSADRDVESAYSRRQPRALRADRASGLRCRGHVARRGLRPRTAGGGRDDDAGAEWRHDDAIRRC